MTGSGHAHAEWPMSSHSSRVLVVFGGWDVSWEGGSRWGLSGQGCSTSNYKGAVGAMGAAGAGRLAD